MILAIDPGNVQSAYVVMNSDTCKPIDFGKGDNAELLDYIMQYREKPDTDVAIEMVACYGMPVGKEVFDTAFWIGRYFEQCRDFRRVGLIYRSEEKMCICGTMRAKDSNIRQALVDRFASHDLKSGKGTKNNRDFFYGFKSDIWQAFAVGYTYRQKGIA